MSIEIPGIVEHIIFPSEKKHDVKDGFAIFSVSLNGFSSKYKAELEKDIQSKLKKKNGYKDYGTFIVTVDSFLKDERYVGGQFVFIGDYSVHPKFGPQFKSENFYEDEPTNEEGLRFHLMLANNIKEAKSKLIIDRFGYEGTKDILDNNPYRLTEVKGITDRMIPDIKNSWDEKKTRRLLSEFLGKHGVSQGIGSKAFDLWREDALDIIQENPYKLTEIKGVGFLMADEVAHKVLKGSVPKKYRVTSCLEYLLKEEVYSNSNLCIPYEILRAQLKGTLENSNQSLGIRGGIEESVLLMNTCIRENLDRIVPVKDMTVVNKKEGIYVYLKKIWDREKFIADDLYKRNSSSPFTYTCSEVDLGDAEDDIKRFAGKDIKLDDCQRVAVKSAFDNSVTVITGGGGTGKSTICRCIFYLAQKKNLSIRMMSPTGKAAQVLASKTRCGAQTIHRSLKFTPDDDYPHDTIVEDIIIVDEVSMVGVDTMFAIMFAMINNRKCHVVFVGDANQLPSVSPGNFLFDIVENNIANVVKLTQIHRQDENSYISLVAKDICDGKVRDIPEEASDIKWTDIDPDSFDMIFCAAIHKYRSENDMDDLQVLSPKYKGRCGVDRCNEIMQQIMMDANKTDGQSLETKFKTLYVGDRVIQTENNYDKMVFNGDIGKIVDLGRKVLDPNVSDKPQDFIIVDFYGDEKVFVSSEITALNLAWCITVHKFQGSQAPNIIFVMSSESQRMMSKELVYTAFTRAEEHLDIYGSKYCLRQAPLTSIIKKRFTNIDKMVRQLREGKKILNVLEGKDGPRKK